ncbi:uncharacterized protein [Haliotis cracherodii]|uniref:uncharacterized protein n=1 Tax=Haliotis cracherodii TaxID=6455 RepID=UPI0039E936EF
MKFAIFLVCLLPIVLAEKRLLIDSLLDTTEIGKLINSVVDKFGSDATEKECETECVVLFKNDILDAGCDFACRGIQGLIHKFHHNKPSAAPATN